MSPEQARGKAAHYGRESLDASAAIAGFPIDAGAIRIGSEEHRRTIGPPCRPYVLRLPEGETAERAPSDIQDATSGMSLSFQAWRAHATTICRPTAGGSWRSRKAAVLNKPATSSSSKTGSRN